MKEQLQKLMVVAWEYGKDLANISAPDTKDWRYIGNLRQGLCDQFEKDTADYRFIRTMTMAVLDWYEAKLMEGKK